jgi:hypothetical protein
MSYSDNAEGFNNEYDACSESGDSSESSDSSESGDLDISICKDIDDLIHSCHTLHTNVIIANNLLGNITDKINKIKSINVIYEGEIMDFYDLLELLHVNTLNNIKEGRSNSFEHQLLKAIDISVFV